MCKIAEEALKTDCFSELCEECKFIKNASNEKIRKYLELIIRKSRVLILSCVFPYINFTQDNMASTQAKLLGYKKSTELTLEIFLVPTTNKLNFPFFVKK